MQIRHLQVTPLEWGCSWTHPVPKLNGKTGCEAARLINILDSFGKAWYGTLWRTVESEWEAHSYGFVPGRRREGAMVQFRCAQWWLAHLREGWMSCYYDIKNAFPSVARWRLDQVIDEVARPPD
eukprot:2193036-Heterocapsa_arctica.AAC.1